jgi:hypothetical protein
MSALGQNDRGRLRSDGDAGCRTLPSASGRIGKGLFQVEYQASNWLGGLGPVARYFTILTAMFGHPGHSKVRLS